jgi:hypothetical protein
MRRSRHQRRLRAAGCSERYRGGARPVGGRNERRACSRRSQRVSRAATPSSQPLAPSRPDVRHGVPESPHASPSRTAAECRCWSGPRAGSRGRSAHCELRHQLGMEHLDSDRPLVPQVSREIDRRHAAPAELASIRWRSPRRPKAVSRSVQCLREASRAAAHGGRGQGGSAQRDGVARRDPHPVP